jgi:DNA processing protein
MLDSSILHTLALSHIPKIGSINTRQLVSYFSGAEPVFNAPKGKLLRVPGIGPKTVDIIIEHRAKALEKAQLSFTRLGDNKEGELIVLGSEKYPNRLQKENDAPLLLFKSGKAELNPPKTIAIVGTRKATPYGVEVTKNIVAELAQYQVQIISGLAYGIDIVAHKAALDNGLSTVAVMANGLDRIYPAVHRKTAELIKENGALLTEHDFGVEAEAYQFPARNRIIAGMADALIVVEASSKGGALITADIADSYNRDVFAVPGSVFSEVSKGTNNLIYQQKAICYTGIHCLEYMTGWLDSLPSTDIAKPKKPEQLSLNMDMFTPSEKLIVEYLFKHPQAHIDEISRATIIPMSEISSVLLNLEFSGTVRSMPGKKFTLAKY